MATLRPIDPLPRCERGELPAVTGGPAESGMEHGEFLSQTPIVIG